MQDFFSTCAQRFLNLQLSIFILASFFIQHQNSCKSKIKNLLNYNVTLFTLVFLIWQFHQIIEPALFAAIFVILTFISQMMGLTLFKKIFKLLDFKVIWRSTLLTSKHQRNIWIFFPVKTAISSHQNWEATGSVGFLKVFWKVPMGRKINIFFRPYCNNDKILRI